MSATLICTEQGKRLHIGIIEKHRWRAICGQPTGIGEHWTPPTSWLARGKPLSPNAKGRTRSVCRSCIAESESIARLAASTEER